jgi:DNA-binding NtrC family response regulator
MLAVEAGPDLGARFPVGKHAPGPALVGTGPACDIKVTDRLVSRRHAAISWEGTRIRVRDLGSTNGTAIDGVAVIEAHAFEGQTIEVGGTRLRLLEAPGDGDQHDAPPRYNFGRFLGASHRLRQLYPLIERLASSSLPLIIEGETGTGKEVLAEAIHEASPRAEYPYVVFDCTAVPASMVEAELFGHERGAFTGATGRRLGLFEEAHQGTLLIDEIGDLPLSLQATLLRAIERAEVRPIGSNKWRRVDVRIIAATRRDLDKEILAGRFRDDLFHRLAVGRIEIPPLRERRADIVTLARQFWTDLGGSGRPPPEAEARWIEDPWPGNVRELRNAVARYLVVGGASAARRPNDRPEEELPTTAYVDEILDAGLPFTVARMKVIAHFEERFVAHALARYQGNVSRAAIAAGIGRRYFQVLRRRSKG